MRLGMCLPPSYAILLFLAILGNITLPMKGKSTINYPCPGRRNHFNKTSTLLSEKDPMFRFFKIVHCSEIFLRTLSLQKRQVLFQDVLRLQFKAIIPALHLSYLRLLALALVLLRVMKCPYRSIQQA